MSLKGRIIEDWKVQNINEYDKIFYIFWKNSFFMNY